MKELGLNLTVSKAISGIQQRLPWAAGAFVSCVLLAQPATRAQVDIGALIEQALDQQVDFEIIDQKLPDAFATVAEETGVPITISREVLRLLPYGADTRIERARLRNVSLRVGLERLVRRLGMRCGVVGDRVEVWPCDALHRIGRRATWAEMATLQWLASLEWTNAPEQIEELRGRLHFRVEQAEPARLLFEAIADVGRGMGDEILDAASHRLGWVWYPRGKHLAIIDRLEQVHRQLQTRVSLRAERRPLAEVLAKLAGQLRVQIHIEPGAILSLPREPREQFSLLLIDASAQQALEVIAGASGLAYRITDEGVFMHNALPAPSQEPPAPGPVDPIVATIVVPDKTGSFEYHFPVRENELPADVRAAWKNRIADISALLRLESQAPAKR